MKVKNEMVIEIFVNRNASKGIESHTGNLYTIDNGIKLMNYGTCLAQFNHDTNTLYVNVSKYSVTTSKIQTYLKREIRQSLNPYFEVVEVKGGYSQKSLF